MEAHWEVTGEAVPVHMEDAHLRTIIADAMQACAARADAMSKELSGNDWVLRRQQTVNHAIRTR